MRASVTDFGLGLGRGCGCGSQTQTKQQRRHSKEGQGHPRPRTLQIFRNAKRKFINRLPICKISPVIQKRRKPFSGKPRKDHQVRAGGHCQKPETRCSLKCKLWEMDDGTSFLGGFVGANANCSPIGRLDSVWPWIPVLCQCCHHFIDHVWMAAAMPPSLNK